MKSLCESTEVPALCMQCLESDPRSEKATNKSQIPLIIVNYLRKNSQEAKSNFTKVAKIIPSRDKELKAAVEICIEKYRSVMDHISSAYIHLKKREYDQATDALSSAIYFYEQTCSQGIQQFKEVFPNLWIFYGMRVLEDLSEAAMRIIDRFV
ncbi:hypothetical protein ACOSQ2_027956 [Xanthoceras sorbifolium]